MIITYIFSSVSLYNPPPNIHDIGVVKIFPAVKQYQQAVWSLFMIVEAFSFAVGLFEQTERQRARQSEVESQRDRAEINLYRAQIKPHFMFNTLNSLYGLFLTHDPKALPSLERYIEMMRYTYASASKEYVTVKEETDYIRQYVALQSLRLNEKTKVALDMDIEDKGLMILPMLLITFVENCFKHGVSPSESSTISISLEEKKGVLTLRTVNRIFPIKRAGEHTGIRNCIRRLDLSYPGRYNLRISDTDNEYKVKLKIEL